MHSYKFVLLVLVCTFQSVCGSLFRQRHRHRTGAERRQLPNVQEAANEAQSVNVRTEVEKAAKQISDSTPSADEAAQEIHTEAQISKQSPGKLARAAEDSFPGINTQSASTKEMQAVSKEMKEAAGASESLGMGVKNGPLLAGVAGETPESAENVQSYFVPLTTPVPPLLNGVFCRGGACSYRVNPPPPTTPLLMTPPPVPIGGNLLSGREFCRGLGCINGMGAPGDPDLPPFQINCLHLFQDVGGGMKGTDLDRSVAQVHASFIDVCQKRVNPLEAPACPSYAATFLGVLAPKVDLPAVGNANDICTDFFWWLKEFKQAEINLKLTAAALPKSTSFLAADLDRFGTGGVGPNSPRGLKWRQWIWSHGMKQQPPRDARQLTDNGALLQVSSDSSDPKPLLPGQDTPEDTPHGLPKYSPNPATQDYVMPQSKSMYQIAPGSPDGAIPPVEVAGDLFDYCSKQFSEIMMGFSQTAHETIKMTKSWCAWQASVTSWVGKGSELGHPDWDARTCAGMETLVAFGLRDQLSDRATGLSAQGVCKKLFLAINGVHRTDGIVKEAWLQSLRGPPEPAMAPKDDSEMKKLLLQAQEYANKIFGRMRQQKAAFDTINNKRMATAAFTPNHIQVSPPSQVAPDLPDSDDLDPVAFLAINVQHQKKPLTMGTSVLSRLNPWGQ